jgi:hypothetical protein
MRALLEMRLRMLPRAAPLMRINLLMIELLSKRFDPRAFSGPGVPLRKRTIQ